MKKEAGGMVIRQKKHKGLWPKFQSLQAELYGTPVKQSGFNKLQNYNYSTKGDIVEAIAPAVKKGGLVFIPIYSSVKSYERATKMGVTYGIKINGFMRVLDPETGESTDIPMRSRAEDSSDKALWKAYTGFQKYFWLRTFGLKDSDNTDEPENDAEKTQGSSQKGNAPAEKVADGNSVALFDYIKQNVENGSKKVNWDKARSLLKGTPQEKELEELYQKHNAVKETAKEEPVEQTESAETEDASKTN